MASAGPPPCAGRPVLADARKSIKAADAAVAAARAASHDEAGTLRVGFIVGTQVEPISRILSAFRHRYPAATLDLTECSFSDPSAGLNSGASYPVTRTLSLDA
jgi:DNA-binding transcriptional LysR family regulator